ncbi:MAG TPA: 3'-5' exonuclease [Spirochaetota bacterium]|nr:3'-5' exonuclease [Spirochaetota bacterium]
MRDFVAIDFETANRCQTSACQIGLVLVENGVIKKEYSQLIKPVPYYFIDDFIQIHGITKEMVSKAPVFKMVWDEISQYFTNVPFIVAHNSGFDMGVLKACLNHYGITAKLPESFCTLKLSRRKLKNLSRHNLSSVCNYLNIPLNHHEALSDARGAAEIVLRLI